MQAAGLLSKQRRRMGQFRAHLGFRPEGRPVPRFGRDLENSRRQSRRRLLPHYARRYTSPALAPTTGQYACDSRTQRAIEKGACPFQKSGSLGVFCQRLHDLQKQSPFPFRPEAFGPRLGNCSGKPGWSGAPKLARSVETAGGRPASYSALSDNR